jgi:hypothetical protein
VSKRRPSASASRVSASKPVALRAVGRGVGIRSSSRI